MCDDSAGPLAEDSFSNSWQGLLRAAYHHADDGALILWRQLAAAEGLAQLLAESAIRLQGGVYLAIDFASQTLACILRRAFGKQAIELGLDGIRTPSTAAALVSWKNACSWAAVLGCCR